MTQGEHKMGSGDSNFDIGALNRSIKSDLTSFHSVVTPGQGCKECRVEATFPVEPR